MAELSSIPLDNMSLLQLPTRSSQRQWPSRASLARAHPEASQPHLCHPPLPSPRIYRLQQGNALQFYVVATPALQSEFVVFSWPARGIREAIPSPYFSTRLSIKMNLQMNRSFISVVLGAETLGL